MSTNPGHPVHVTVYFRGRVTIKINPEENPHYFEDDEARGGLEALTEDLFYDEAELRGYPFVEGSSEFMDAFFDDPERADD